MTSEEPYQEDLAKQVASLVQQYGLEQILMALQNYYTCQASVHVSKSDVDFYMGFADFCEKWLDELFDPSSWGGH